ncbi:MAG TPA: hypothetical protein VK071_05160 [Tissierellales bacterium]|nr:hypothetical protein [Tissierellales bacterium]
MDRYDLNSYVAMGIGMGISNITYSGPESMEVDTTLGIIASGGKGMKEVSIDKTELHSNLLDELANSGVKYNVNDIVAITKTPDGRSVWLENGNSKAGLKHVMKHADEFISKGIPEKDISKFIMEALENGKVVGYQGRGTGRPIYEVVMV